MLNYPSSCASPSRVSGRTVFILYMAPLSVFAMFRWWLGYRTAPDTAAYLEMGRGIFDHLTFGYMSDTGRYLPNAIRVPVIPFIMGALYRITGQAEAAYSVYTWLQVLLAPMLPVTAFYFGRHMGRGVAWAAWAFLSLSPNVIMCSLYALTDMPFAVLSCAVYISLWRALEAGTYRRFGVAGLATGAACMLRPIMKLYFLAAAVIMLTRHVRLRYLAAFLAVFAVVVTPWLVRNTMLYGRPIFDTSQGVNLLWSNAGLVRIKDTDSSATRHLKAYVLANRNLPDMIMVYDREYWLSHDLEYSRTLQAIALEAYRENPGAVLKNWLRQAATLTGSTSHLYDLYKLAGSSAAVRRVSEHLPNLHLEHVLHGMYVCAKWTARLLYVVVSLVGLVMLVACGHRRIAVFAGMNILYFSSLIALVAGYDRYRLNMEPLYAVLIVFPFCFVAARVRSGAPRRQS